MIHVLLFYNPLLSHSNTTNTSAVSRAACSGLVQVPATQALILVPVIRDLLTYTPSPPSGHSAGARSYSS
jgi:hypothetical protein